MKNFFRRSAAGIMGLALTLANAGFTAIPGAAAAGEGISINEVCPKNSTFPAPDGGLYDWVELYNSSGSSVDISGWGLTDKDTKPYRFTFPAGTVIGAGQRLTVFCDGTAGAADTSIAPFGLSTSGETLTLTDAAGNQVSKITFGSMAADTSYGQYPDGSGEYYTLSCTPGSANAAPEGSYAVRLPEFSAESGFYDTEFQLSITAPEGTTVYYTTDGSDPDTSSEKYTGAIRIYDRSSEPNVYSQRDDVSANGTYLPEGTVDKAMIVRAVAVDSQGRVSDVATRTYFLGKTNGSYYKDMKVVSLVTDPDNLFDYEKGIYVKGKIFDEENQNTGGGWGGWGGFGRVNTWEMAANYTQHGREWERPATFELFENGKSVLSQDVGIRIKGAASRAAAQKSFNVYARTDYGKDSLEYDFFEGKATKKKNGKVIDKFDSITLRNGGNDISDAFFRDSINQSLVSDRNMAVQSTSECMVFIDGEFWGIYQIIERVNDDYINTHYGIKKSDVAIVKNGELEEGTDQDKAAWDELVTFCSDNDMTNAANYERFTSQVDVQSYMDYFAAQLYWNNADWPQNNFAVWRSMTVDETNPYADGKWRMFLFDTEFCSALYGENSDTTGVSVNAFSRIATYTSGEPKMFTNLLKNQDFRAQFERTVMDLENYNFTSDKTSAAVNYYITNFRQQIIDTFKRYGYNSNPFGGQSYDSKLTEQYSIIDRYLKERPQYLNQHLKSALEMKGELRSVTVNNQTEKGTIHVNTLTLGDEFTKWTGQYFSDYDITVSAEPKEGYKFKCWDASGVMLTDEQIASKTITIPMTADVNLTAVYEIGSDEPARGDYNGDGSVNIADAVVLQRFLLGEDVELADTDMYEDGITDAFDLALLRKELIK